MEENFTDEHIAQLFDSSAQFSAFWINANALPRSGGAASIAPLPQRSIHFILDFCVLCPGTLGFICHQALSGSVDHWQWLRRVPGGFVIEGSRDVIGLCAGRDRVAEALRQKEVVLCVCREDESDVINAGEVSAVMERNKWLIQDVYRAVRRQESGRLDIVVIDPLSAQSSVQPKGRPPLPPQVPCNPPPSHAPRWTPSLVCTPPRHSHFPFCSTCGGWCSPSFRPSSPRRPFGPQRFAILAGNSS